MLSFIFVLFSFCESGHGNFFSDLINYMYGDIFRLIKLCFIRGFSLGFRLVDFSFITRGSSMLNIFYKNVPVALHLDYFRVTISAMNICYIPIWLP